jgi:hypothetical protein
MYKLQQVNKNELIDHDKLYYAEELQQVQLPFDTFEIIKDIDNYNILVQKINDQETQPTIVNKEQFEKNIYSLRPRNKK